MTMPLGFFIAVGVLGAFLLDWWQSRRIKR
jgi:uncharacterized membrane protein YedE/YeeE